MGRGAARVLTFVLGVWMIISAYAWRHDSWQHTNAIVVGVIMAVASLAALRDVKVRWLDTLVAVWLMFSGFFLPARTVGTAINNFVVGVVAYLATLVAGTRSLEAPRRIERRTTP